MPLKDGQSMHALAGKILCFEAISFISVAINFSPVFAQLTAVLCFNKNLFQNNLNGFFPSTYNKVAQEMHGYAIFT